MKPIIINAAEQDKTDEVIAKVQFQQGLILILKLVQISNLIFP